MILSKSREEDNGLFSSPFQQLRALSTEKTFVRLLAEKTNVRLLRENNAWRKLVLMLDCLEKG